MVSSVLFYIKRISIKKRHFTLFLITHLFISAFSPFVIARPEVASEKKEEHSSAYDIVLPTTLAGVLLGIIFKYFAARDEQHASSSGRDDASRRPSLWGFLPFDGSEAALAGNRLITIDLPELGTREASSSKQLDTRKRVVSCAEQYLGKLKWLIEADPTWYTVDTGEIDLMNLGTSDLLLLYWKSGCHIPDEIISQVKDKKALVHSDDEIEPHQMLQMNCWGFCFLSLLDAGILTEAQMDRLCSIAHMVNGGRIVKSLYRGPNRLQLLSSENLPGAGDIILFFDFENGVQIIDPTPYDTPAHAAIWIGEMQYISLIEGCEITSHTLESSGGARAHFISLDAIAENIASFLEIYEGDEFQSPLYDDLDPMELLPNGL